MVISLRAVSSSSPATMFSLQDEPQAGPGSQVVGLVGRRAAQRQGQLGVAACLPGGQVAVAEAELDVGQMSRHPVYDLPVATVQMAGQQQVAHDQVALPAGLGEVARDDLDVVVNSGDPAGAGVVAEFEVRQVDTY